MAYLLTISRLPGKCPWLTIYERQSIPGKFLGGHLLRCRNRNENCHIGPVDDLSKILFYYSPLNTRSRVRQRFDCCVDVGGHEWAAAADLGLFRVVSERKNAAGVCGACGVRASVNYATSRLNLGAELHANRLSVALLLFIRRLEGGIRITPDQIDYLYCQ